MILISPIIIHPKPSNVEIQDEAASELQVIIFGRKGGESRRRDDSLLEDKKVPRSPNKQKIQEKKSETIPMVGGLASNKAREKVCSIEVKLVMSSMGLYGSKLPRSDVEVIDGRIVVGGSVLMVAHCLYYLPMSPSSTAHTRTSHLVLLVQYEEGDGSSPFGVSNVNSRLHLVQITSQSSGLLHLNGYS
ncbi:hypothetical protein F2Q68_00008829 [Brassica cretica]|uniref:Uncharacterized protein n=1 Tax=Brassica cretica TaxID=69181 RepID=A0A8S9KLR2_BRACR|nr:hypothetical protein F2Q68_00008829 [Brassica cretica]